MTEKYEFPKTDVDIDFIIANWMPMSNCPWCKSDKLSFPLVGYRVCNNCGKHALFYYRYPFLEESALPISTQHIKDVWNDSRYAPENRMSGKRPYLLKKLMEKL